MRTIGEVAELAGVSIRTLRHYDELGLLRPSARSDGGYRLYDRADVERLHEILVWRQLGFPLIEIRAMLDDPRHDRLTAIRRQRALAERERERLTAVIRALDAALKAHDDNINTEEATMFDGFDHERYEEEARERWGDTDAYAESARRSARYGEEQWQAIKAESEEIARVFATLMHDGEPATGPQARATAERHRRHISDWFYPCSPEMHRALGEMYVQDERFTANYERVAPGLAAYVHEAIAANAGAPAR
jgi:MerR family transcriptional regulator, thiopeptide resistance regulator